MKEKEKRKPRAYKVGDSSYIKAQKRGEKEGEPLASLLEKVVTCYSKGWNIAIFDKSAVWAVKINSEPLPELSKNKIQGQMYRHRSLVIRRSGGSSLDV